MFLNKNEYLCTRILKMSAENGDPLAQSVEHHTFNVGVLGSNPKRITEGWLEAILFPFYYIHLPPECYFVTCYLSFFSHIHILWEIWLHILFAHPPFFLPTKPYEGPLENGNHMGLT